ncbi:Solute carrier family 25 member 48, partial [Tetrabaena socialis]
MVTAGEPVGEWDASLRDFISGAVAGAFAITLSQPLDTVRVRLQQRTGAGAGAGPGSTAGVLLAMLRREGVWSPWKGLTYPLLFASVQSAILFQASGRPWDGAPPKTVKHAANENPNAYGWTMRQLASSQAQPQQGQQRSTSSTSTTTTTCRGHLRNGSSGGDGDGVGTAVPSGGGRPQQQLAAASGAQPCYGPLPTPWHGFVAGGVAGFAQ